MKFKSFDTTLKNGETVTIRECTIADAERFMSTVKSYLADSEFIPKKPGEFRLTLDQEKEWIASFSHKANSLLLVAEYEGEIIGNIDLNGSPRKSMQHTAVIGMGLLSNWRNCGLGTQLMNAVISWARQNELLKLLWLQVYTDNVAGIALYEKCGFTENGVIDNFFFSDGRYSGVLTMSLVVEN